MESQLIQCLVVTVNRSLPVVASAAQPPQRQREINLALSACPAAVASKAAVCVLEAVGYESHNAFTAVVQYAMPTSRT